MVHLVRKVRSRHLVLSVLVIAICLTVNIFYHSNLPSLGIAWPDRLKEEPFFVRKHQADCVSPAVIPHPVRAVSSEFDAWERARDCGLLRRRHYYPSEANSDRESSFPLAYVILVESGLEQVEMLFNAIYAPQNYYCFHVDFRSHYMTHDFVGRLSGCFRNGRVFVSDQSVPTAASSAGVLLAQRACLIKLAAASTNWRYALTIEATDFPLRTNREIVEILSLHEGANDVELVEPLAYRYEKEHRPVTDQYGQLIDMEETSRGYPPPPAGNLKIYKGNMASALSRPFVDYLLTSETSTGLLSWLAGTYIPSEVYVSTLNHNERPAPPGGYPGRCMDEKKRKAWVSRFTLWNTYHNFECHGQWKKGKCVFGEEDLPLLEKRRELFAHEFDLRQSPLVLDCLHERLFNATYNTPDQMMQLRPFMDYYRNLSAVQYHNWKRSSRAGQRFVCVACQDCDH